MINTASGALRHIHNIYKDGARGNYFFLCLELDEANGRGRISPGAHRRAIDHIGQLLGNNYTLNSWVTDRCEAANDLKISNPRRYKEKMHETRLAWIEDMIKWHEARGD